MIGLIYVALRDGVSGDEATSNNLPAGVDRLIPTSGSNVLSQSTVGIDLAAGYDAYLIINDVEVRELATRDNEDGLVKIPTQNIVQYSPAQTHRITELAAPRSCVIAMVYRTGKEATTPEPVSWCFTVT